jgi:lipoic acid synthetase
MENTARKPEWLRARLPSGAGCNSLLRLAGGLRLHTVCQSARCPNLGECWSRGTATLLILGDICTRACRFCAVATGRPLPPDPDEPARAAEAVARLGLRHCVITSVCRDELPDGGAAHWAAVIRAVRERNPRTAIEVLTGDFNGDAGSLDTVLDARPDIFNHNLETVERLQKSVRGRATYGRSRQVVRHAKARGFVTKTGLMLGLGETEEEVARTLRDIAGDGTDIVTIGQYLQPTARHLPVARWVAPEEFARWKREGEALGIGTVESGPLVRSSYHADEQSRRHLRPAAGQGRGCGIGVSGEG